MPAYADPRRIVRPRERVTALAAVVSSPQRFLGMHFFSPVPIIFWAMIIGFVLHKTIGFRVSEEEEREGVDSSEHAETSYDLGALGAALRGMSFGVTPPRVDEVTRTNHDEEVTA